MGATLTVTGAVPVRIPFLRTFATQLGGSFVNRIVPARLGGIAINVRFLQKQGLELAVASSSVGLQQLSGLLMHVTLSFIFLLWAGRSGVGAFDFLPSGQTVLIGLTVVLALSGLLFLLPAGRGVLRKRVLPLLRRSGEGIGGRSPAGRSRWPSSSAAPLLLTLSYIAALVFCVHAFGADWGECRQHRRRLPPRLGHQLGGADAGGHRRRRGGAHRRPHRHRHRTRGGGAGRLPLPHRDLLAADPAGLDRLRRCCSAGATCERPSHVRRLTRSAARSGHGRLGKALDAPIGS